MWPGGLLKAIFRLESSNLLRTKSAGLPEPSIRPPSRRAKFCRRAIKPAPAGNSAQQHAGCGHRRQRDGLVQWAKSADEPPDSAGDSPAAASVETIRDHRLSCHSQRSTTSREVKTARATSILPGRVRRKPPPLAGRGAVAVLRDLTETERVEKPAATLSPNVSHRTAHASHIDSGICGDVARQLPENGAPTREFLEIIRKNSARMSPSRRPALPWPCRIGETRFDVEPVPPAELLHDAEESFREIARPHGIDLHIADLPSRKSSRSSGRPRSYPPSLSNLIDNALKIRSCRRTHRPRCPAVPPRRILRPGFRRRRCLEHLRASSNASIASIRLAPRIRRNRPRLAIAKHIMLATAVPSAPKANWPTDPVFLFTLPTA